MLHPGRTARSSVCGKRQAIDTGQDQQIVNSESAMVAVNQVEIEAHENLRNTLSPSSFPIDSSMLRFSPGVEPAL
jgi:hypothetical protein